MWSPEGGCPVSQQSGFNTQAPGSVLSTADQPSGQPQSPVKWYHRKWFVVLALLFFFPLGLVLLWTSPETRLSGRIVWTAVVALALLVRLGGGSEGPTAAGTGAQAGGASAASIGDHRVQPGDPAAEAGATPAASATAGAGTQAGAAEASTDDAAAQTDAAGAATGHTAAQAGATGGTAGDQRTQAAPAAAQAKDEFNLTVTDTSTGTTYKGKMVSNVGFAVLNVDTAKAVGSDFFVEKAAGGAKFALVKVYVANKQKEALTLDASLFTLVADGSEYEYSIPAFSAMELSEQTESLFLKKLNPGLSVVATIPFEVPDSLDLSRAELRFRTGLLGRAETVPLSPVTE